MTSASILTGVSRLAITAVLTGCGVLIAGCSLKQDMADQPKNLPLWPSDFFADGRSARPLVENTVARGSLENANLYVPKDSNTFPVRVDMELLERGRERYNIFCSPCHGLQGNGDGMVAVRGMKHPPTYHQERLRQVPNGYIFDVITNGFGVMQDYSAQVPPRDRWAIVAYVRALQLSKDAKVSELPPDIRDKVLHSQATQTGAASHEGGPGGKPE